MPYTSPSTADAWNRLVSTAWIAPSYSTLLGRTGLTSLLDGLHLRQEVGSVTLERCPFWSMSQRHPFNRWAGDRLITTSLGIVPSEQIRDE